MSDQQDITLGEVYRMLERILEQTTKTNGRLREVEKLTAQHTWAIAAIGAVALALLGVVLKVLFKV